LRAGDDGVQAEIEKADQAAGQQLIQHDARPRRNVAQALQRIARN
jgi:hypothetical protein